MAEDTIGDDWEDFEERVDDVSPGDASIGRNGGGATLPYYCLPVDLVDRIDETLETVEQEPRGTDGGLRRTNPLAHPWPEFRHYYASRIHSIRGAGLAEKVESEGEWLEAPGPAYYSNYPLLSYSIQFDPRPYAVLSDDSIDTENIRWWNDDAEEFTTPCATEWRRNTVIKKGPSTTEVITATFGGLKLRLGGDTADDRQLMAMPSIMIPKSTLIVVHVACPQWWHLSPVNNYDAMMGRTNQVAFLGYGPASLVLSQVSASDPYSPPRPEMDYEDVVGVVVQDKIVDITMVFDIYTRDPEVEIEPDHANDVCGPAQCLPHIDGKFYYATTVGNPDSAEEGRPRFRSGVFQFLFRSPIEG